MNWFRLSIVCVLGYAAGTVFDRPDMGGYWFVAKSMISTLIALSCLLIHTKISDFIALVELSFIMFTFSAAHSYLLNLPGFAYDYYGHIINGCFIIELMLLIFGAPWHAIWRFFGSLGTADNYRVQPSVYSIAVFAKDLCSFKAESAQK